MARKRYIRFRLVVSTLLLFGCFFVCLLGLWAINLEALDVPNWIVFVGRFHPALLHMPIGFFVLAILIDLLRVGSLRQLLPDTGPLMGLVSFAAILASLHGILLFVGEDFGGSELARRHLIGGCVFSVFSTIIFLFKIWLSNSCIHRRMSLFFMSAAFLTMSFVSHDGASLTHGSDYLFKYAPKTFRSLFGLEKVQEVVLNSQPLEQRAIYEVAIAPILQQSCIQCHREEKSNGRLRMDSFAMFMQGGKSGMSLVPKDATASLFLQRIHLPKTDEEHMPPVDHIQLSSVQVKILEWWVQEGAPELETLESLSPSKEILLAIRSMHSKEDLHDENEELPDVDLSNLSLAVSKFNENLTGRLSFLQAGQPVLYYDCFDGPKSVNNEVLEDLVSFAPHIQELNLNYSNVTSSGVIALLEACHSLEMISLNGCNVDDALVESLLACNNLKSISLRGTQLTNSGLLDLVTHPSIRNIYASDTAVTPVGKRAALAKLRRLQIHMGYDE